MHPIASNAASADDSGRVPDTDAEDTRATVGASHADHAARTATSRDTEHAMAEDRPAGAGHASAAARKRALRARTAGARHANASAVARALHAGTAKTAGRLAQDPDILPVPVDAEGPLATGVRVGQRPDLVGRQHRGSRGWGAVIGALQYRLAVIS